MGTIQQPLTPQIQANANTIPKGSIDCGITAIGCCNGPGCQKLGTMRLFLTFLVLTGIIQGAAERYFQISVQQAALEHGFDETIINWLMVTGGILQSLLAIFITYWAGRFHQIAWLGGLVITQAIGCFLVIIPTLANHSTEYSAIENTPVSVLCQPITNMRLMTPGRPFSDTTLALMFVLQLGIALGNTAFYTLGLSYLDDNAELVDSPSLIGTALAAKFWGPQLGSAIALAVNATPFGWWLGWAFISPTLFILGVILAIFPRRLLRTVVKMAANRIIEENNLSIPQSPKFLDDINLWPSIKRIFSNKIVMLNIVALVFIQTATVNYLQHENSYLQSRFFLPSHEGNGIINEWTSRFISHLLKPPIVGLCILVAGLIIAKINPCARSLALWNVGVGALLCILYISYIFIKCPEVKIAGTVGNKIALPFCAQNCNCPSNIPFSPVCSEGTSQTYYSPCHAGCRVQSTLNDIILYQNCSCSTNSDSMLPGYTRATEGACNFRSCQKMWIIFQIMIIFAAAFLSTGIVGRIIITIRSVIPQDKHLALSVDLFLAGIITYIPGKIGYDIVSRYTCQYIGVDSSHCYLNQSPLHGNILNILSASLMLFSVLFDLLVFFFVKNLECYRDGDEDSFKTIPLRAMSSNSRFDQTANENVDNIDSAQPLIRSIQSTQDNYGSHSDNLNKINEITYANLQFPGPSGQQALDFSIQPSGNSSPNPTNNSSTVNTFRPTSRTTSKDELPISPETNF